MNNADIVAAVAAGLSDKDTTIAALREQIAGTVVPPPVVVPPVGDIPIMLQNMARGTDGIYRSTHLGNSPSGDDQKCYFQFRLSAPPQKFARFRAKRLTNIIPDGRLNLKTMRVWPDGTYPDEYVARGIGEGAEKFTTETPTSTGYLSIPWKNGIWMDELYEFDYANRTVSITIDGMNWTAHNWNYGALNRTQFGVQMVCANPASGACLPPGSYVAFDALSLEHS